MITPTIGTEQIIDKTNELSIINQKIMSMKTG